MIDSFLNKNKDYKHSLNNPKKRKRKLRKKNRKEP